ncbi:MAG: YihY/virulence factor BrkB family protein [Flavobacteriales bacterium]|jgi:membrane protein|nr:YihY/virulence factor BrkB family protein [Flavobacteriales bacterium]
MLKKWLNRLLESRLVKLPIAFAKNIKPWGFEGLSLFAVARFFIEGMQKGAVSTRAAAISFQILMAIFPFLIMLLSLLPMIPISDFQSNLFDSIRGFFPGDTFSLVEETIADLLTKSHSTVFSIGFVLSLFYASNSVNAIMQGFNASYNLGDKGNPMVLRLVSVVLMIVLSLFMIISVALIIFSGMVFDKLIELNILSEDLVFLLSIAKWLITVFLMYGSITILYNMGDFKNTKWKTFSAGAIVTTVLYIITSLLFAWFVNNFATYNKLYGSLGTILLLMIWVNLNSVILLIGFELNTSISKAKLDAKLMKELNE